MELRSSVRDSHNIIRLSVSTIEIEFPNFLEVAYPPYLQLQTTEYTEEKISQWVHKINAYSSQYGEKSWSANQIIGPPQAYPAYGDIVTSWAPRGTGTRYEYVDINFEEAVVVKQLEVYETYNPGGIINVQFYDLDEKKWISVYQGPSLCGTISESRIFTVDISLPIYSERCKIEVDQNGIGSWYEINAIKLHGIAKRRKVCDSNLITKAAKLPYKYLLDTGVCSDIQITLFDQKDNRHEFSAHKIILSRFSFFKKLFKNNNNDYNNDKKLKIEIRGVEFRVFEIFLEWIYTNSLTSVFEDGEEKIIIQNQIKYFIPLFILSKEFGIVDLQRMCEYLFSCQFDKEDEEEIYSYFKEIGMSSFVERNIKFQIDKVLHVPLNNPN